MSGLRPRVVVAGLGPAGPELVTTATRDALARIPHRYLRTSRHAAATLVPDVHTFDATYAAAPAAPDLDTVYRTIADALVEAAEEHGEVLYLVPGSPTVAERTVDLLRADPRIDVEILPALSFIDLAWSRLGIDPIAVGARLVDGQRFAVEAAGEAGPWLVAQCDTRDVLSAIKLAIDDDAAPEATTVLQGLGSPDERVTTVAWADLDRGIEPDHLTSLWIPRLAAPVAHEVQAFAELVRTLRAACPWDREQTHQSLTRHLLEETYEVLEAIEALDGDQDGSTYGHLEEELGDLLFQVVFHATLAAEQGAFTLADVARGIHDKLVARHPHVFPPPSDLEAELVPVQTAEHVKRNWEELKRIEKGRASVMEGIPASLPSLLYAHKVQRKAASIGVEVDLSVPTIPRPTNAAEVGEALFQLVAAARAVDVDPEAALRAAAARFRDEVEATR